MKQDKWDRLWVFSLRYGAIAVTAVVATFILLFCVSAVYGFESWTGEMCKSIIAAMEIILFTPFVAMMCIWAVHEVFFGEFFKEIAGEVEDEDQ